MDLINSLIFWVEGGTSAKFLGGGAEGLVFQSARNTALKISVFDHTLDPEILAKMEKRALGEYKVLKGKHHENVIKMMRKWKISITLETYDKLISSCHPLTGIDFWESKRRNIHRHKEVRGICIEMELCGPTLRKWLDLVQPVDDDALESEWFRFFEIKSMQASIAGGIINGIKFLHEEEGILHRDLKPDNIMFSWDSRKDGFRLPVKIADLGICRNYDIDANNNFSSSEESITGNSYLFSRAYQASWTTKKAYRPNSERHSLALVLFELLHPVRSCQDRTRKFLELEERQYHNVKDHFMLQGVVELIKMLTSKRDSLRMSEISIISKSTLARNSVELQHLLTTASPGKIIQIVGGIFHGTFKLKTSGVRIEGGFGGGKTILRANIQPQNHKIPGLLIACDKCLIKSVYVEIDAPPIFGHEHSYTCISIRGKGNTLYKVKTAFGTNSIQIKGSSNLLQQCTLINADNGVILKGDSNKLNCVKFNNIGSYGIELTGSDNTISAVECYSVQNGIGISNGSNSNLIFNFRYIKSCKIKGHHTNVVWIRQGANNRVEKLYCEELEVETEDYDLLTGSKSNSTRLSDSTCGSVEMGGVGNMCTNVDFMERFVGKGTQLKGCTLKGKKCP